MANETVLKVKAEPSTSWMALENMRLGYERLLIVWVQTAMSLISFGFTIYKFFQYLHDAEGERVERLLAPRAFGVFMIGTGLFLLLAATFQHRLCINKLRVQHPEMPVSLFSLAHILAASIATFGIIALIAAIIRQ